MNEQPGLHGRPRLALLIALAALAAACTSHPAGKSPPRIAFGTVQAVENVPPGGLPAGTVVGGYAAVFESVAGAPQDPRIVSMLRSSTRVYTIQDHRGKVLRFATDKTFLVEGDCVAVEYGEAPNLRLVGDRYCAPGTRRTSASSELERDARDCDAARRRLARARTEPEISAAQRSVQATCQYRR